MFQSIQVLFMVFGLGVSVVFAVRVGFFLVAPLLKRYFKGGCPSVADVQPTSSYLATIEGDKREAAIDVFMCRV